MRERSVAQQQPQDQNDDNDDSNLIKGSHCIAVIRRASSRLSSFRNGSAIIRMVTKSTGESKSPFPIIVLFSASLKPHDSGWLANICLVFGTPCGECSAN
jgi:hypothetical protein